MVFVCSECGREFEKPRIVEEYHGEWDRAGECLAVSPCCADGVGQAVRCRGCGEWTAQESAHHGLCPGCAKQAVERLRALLKSEFSREEREVINDAFDAVPLTQVEEGGN